MTQREKETGREGREEVTLFLNFTLGQPVHLYQGEGKEVATLFSSGFALFVVKCFELSKG